jgi:hypothetical protein
VTSERSFATRKTVVFNVYSFVIGGNFRAVSTYKRRDRVAVWKLVVRVTAAIEAVNECCLAREVSFGFPHEPTV